MTHKFTLKPTIYRPVVPLDVVVKSGVEFVWVEYLYGSLLPSRANGLALAEVYLNVDHLVRKRLQFGIVVCGAIEDKVARLQVTLRKALVRQQVELVRLVPFSKRVAELLPEVEDALSNQCATV